MCWGSEGGVGLSAVNPVTTMPWGDAFLQVLQTPAQWRWLRQRWSWVSVAL